jgi:hypothetical protein
MTTYYVATLARYVLVEADDEADARRKAVAVFAHRWPDIHAVPRIKTVRPATDGTGLECWQKRNTTKNGMSGGGLLKELATKNLSRHGNSSATQSRIGFNSAAVCATVRRLGFLARDGPAQQQAAGFLVMAREGQRTERKVRSP